MAFVYSCSCRVVCISLLFFFFFKLKTAYEMRISDWSSDVCSSDLAMVASANWRGYTASWEIADGRLVLRDATILVAGEEAGDYTPESILGDLFPSTEAPVVADWYSGALIIPDGERTKYVHMGYGSSYERYQVLRIAAGRVVEHVKLSAGEFERYKADTFEAFTATEEYRQALAELDRQSGALSDAQLDRKHVV